MGNLLEELERAVYVAPTVENMRAYIDALEAHILNMGDVQKELNGTIEELDLAYAHISDLEDELDKAADKIIEYENALGID